ncbi:glutamate receptor 2.9-like isoform X3 [Sorghum bicolor]|uniref:Glutamate receptor n=2 Tax=Sorghum bicolor TaxID=4558 RepID=A0A194YHR6_SORBI|nr:glutamate receptor 2.9-like isoform X3 [Sorghum bicolor]KXG19505.1 hypothetical protein SORBI_3010G068600 [Sorghum bicolor]|eukprot:XP_021304275.1 glutamate receptor 2.9-like isoform X3 [Sorghum bicolor]
MVLRSMIPGGLALLHLLLGVLPSASASASASELPPAAAAVRVGVVLDLTSEVGRKSLTCISMALDDFYSAHANSRRRVDLLVRDSRGDVVAAARAAEDLIRNNRVQAIIGPLTSAEAEFIAYLGKHTLTPVLSLAPISAALTPSVAPFFLHTAPIYSSQAELTAAILDKFRWRKAILVYEDSPYGAGILPELVYALQGYNTFITDCVALPIDATENYLDTVVYSLKENSTRVFIVHMLPHLGARFFRQASVADMMSDGYVWIATAGFGSAVDSFGPDRIDDMQGVVTFRPYVQSTDRIMNFTVRFKEKFQMENPGIRGVPSPSLLLLWAYDTAWSLAAAVNRNRVSRSTPGRTLLGAVLDTTFDGLAGRFRLRNGLLQVSTYEVVNIIGKGARTVGFWTPESGIFKNLKANNEKGLKQILWPGDLATAPRGWDVSSTGSPLRVIVPSRHGFDQLVKVSYNPTNISVIVTGYCIDVFDALMKNLPYLVAYQYVPFNDTSTYDSILNLVYEKEADAVVGDTTISTDRMNKVAFTMPYTDIGLSMIVVLKKYSSRSMWIFLQPLTHTLWITSLAFFFLTGFVVWVIEHRINPEFRGTPWQQFGIIFYFAFSTLVFSHKEKLESNLSRLVVIVWVFVVLILTSSYTASLTSMLTFQQFQPTVTSVQDLLRNGHFVGYQRGSTVKYWLEEMGFHKKNLLGYGTVEEYAEALQMGSENGGVSAIFDENPYLKIFLSKYCEGYTMVGPTYRLGGFGFCRKRWRG